MATKADLSTKTSRQMPSYNPLAGGHLGEIIATNRSHGINGALRRVLLRAIEHARKTDPNGHLVELSVPMVQFLKLFFPGGRFDNPKKVYLAYSQEAVTEIMRQAYEYEKGEMVKTMSHLMGSGTRAADIVTADMDEWSKMQPLIKDFIWGDNIHVQARYIEDNLSQRFDRSGDLEITTRHLKEVMFWLIGRLMVPDYQPSAAQLTAHVEEFEWLIAQTSKLLFETIFASEKFVDKLMQKQLSEEVQERYQAFYGQFKALQRDDDGGMLTAMLKSDIYDEEKRQANFIAMFEAGSKTLTQVSIETFLACARNRELWNQLKENVGDRKMLTAAIFEAARRTPPVDLTFREAMHSHKLLGYDIPAGSIITISVHDMLVDPDYWQDPEKFILNRDDPARRKYLPWLDPVNYDRGCAGMPYSISVGIATLKFFIEAFDHIELAEDYGMKYDATVQHDVKLMFRRR